MNERDRQFVLEIVRMTIAELQRAGMLKETRDSAYAEANDLLKRYFDQGEKDEAVKAALDKLKGDKYFGILPMFYGYGYTIDEIADGMEVEASTVSRNKKRLCLEVYKYIQ